MTDPRSFGSWLQRERERRGITLRSIADRTKIGARLLEGLERGDVSRWPGGIYRRSFVRGYADAVGLDADLVVANFERVFPSDPSEAIPTATLVPRSVEQPEMRLALVTPAVSGITAGAMKTAARDLACVFGCALVGFAIGGGVGFWSAAASAAIVFHLYRVLGLECEALWRRIAERRHSAPETRGAVVNFTEEHSRSTARRAARVRRVLSDLSAAAISAATHSRRAARS
jgi:transcriptional regulator with XRE-family HTH domain